MLLISTTHRPATDLGYLLHKNPVRAQEVELTFGAAWVVYPEATEERCTAAVMLQIDPVGLVRRKDGAGSLAQYVNDRPYVASSFLSVALSELFGTAIAGRCKERPELVTTPIPLEIRVPVLSCRAAEERIARLFAPLGYEVSTSRLQLDEHFPEWGESHYYDVTLRGTVLLRDALRHLYLLLPVLDAKKHYFMDKTEVDKLMSKGEGWLANHPEKDWIVRSSLGRKPSLMREALEQLANIEESLEAEENTVDEAFIAPEESATEPKESLHTKRHNRIVERVREIKPQSLVDLGCGDGKLLRQLIKVQGLNRILGMDVSYFEIETAERALHLDEASPHIRERIQLIHGSLMYRDERLEGFDVATVIEVIEHLDQARLAAFERVVFECAQPKHVLLTTPNREYNAVYELDDKFRHTDHRFEWDREQFATWVERISEIYGYRAQIEGIGEEHEAFGCPSQMVVFTR